MTNIAIKTENLSKQYEIGAKKLEHNTLRDFITEGILKFSKRKQSLEENWIWALKDVAFEVKHGEKIGVIGKNGAGKSTLLKILTRITQPTTGRVYIYGRVGSLLEVGTGFHPELTGRDNIYLNGAILGMRRKEIRQKFDEIVAFSEMDQFIDTPVKRYSSGMYVRLAFAVAAHLSPDILIVDEVLSVGDAAFQKKCIGKMDDVASEGRTIFFVSHNMGAINRLCNRCLLFQGGKLIKDGLSHQITNLYLAGNNKGTNAEKLWESNEKRPGAEIAQLNAIRIKTDGIISEDIEIKKSIEIEMEYEVLKAGYKLLPNYHLYNQEGIYVFATLDSDPKWRGLPRPRGKYLSRVLIPGNFFSEGIYYVGGALIALDPVIPQFYEKDAVSFQIYEIMDGTSARGDYGGGLSGIVRPLLKWETEQMEVFPQ